MPMTAPPLKTAISDTYPLPDNATARTGFGVLYDYLTGILGTTGFLAGMLSASKILDPDALYNISLVPSVAGNALTMKMTAADGAGPLAAGNPATVSQRHATLATGLFLSRNITGDLTLVISSGSTLGHQSAVASYIYWYLIDFTGTQELAASTKDFGKRGIISTTAEGGVGAADSATVMYSATARSNVAFRRIGRTIDSQAAAGTYTAVPTSVELDELGDSRPTSMPPGLIFGYGGASVPSSFGCLVCDGSSQLRTDYPYLFNEIGTTWGSVDGTHFTLPDLRGRTIIGDGTGAGLTARTVAGSGGEEAHTPTLAEVFPHTHTYRPTFNAGGLSGTGGLAFRWDDGSTASGSAGSGSAFNVMQPFKVVKMLISY